MAVQRRDVAAVLNDDRIAVSALHTAKQNFSVTGCSDRCARRSRVVDAAVRTDRVENRVTPTRIEARADAREVQRSADECFAYTAAFRRVVARASRLVDEARRAKGLTLVHELCRDDLAVAQFDSVAPELLINDGELVAYS